MPTLSLRRILALSKQAGASEFYKVVWKSDIKQAFKQAQEDAEDDRAFDEEDEDDDESWGSRAASYTGTILEKNGYKILSEKPVLEAEARKLAYKDIDDNDKWGPAFARALKRTPKGKKIEGWIFYGLASS